MVTPIKSYKGTFVILLAVLIIFILINISLGSVYIPIKEILASLFNGEVEKESWRAIVINYRLPKAVTALIVGSGLSISGLLMQTLFRNPLAGPFVLGISSGASLGVAILIMGATFLGTNIANFAFSSWGIAIAASAGSFLVLLAVMLAAIKVRNTMSILIIGLMFGSLTSAIISILAYFSSASQLQQYMFWSFGSLGNLNWKEISALFITFVIGILLVTFIIKPLNSLLLGENYAKSMGVNVKLTRNITLIATSILTGVITAFSGPIAFIGLAVPHLTKLLFNTSNHKTLLPAVAITGSIVMLICDSIAQLPNSEFTLPINAITSLFGAPIIIWLLVRKRKIYY
ncbi:iron complex transport system permease protein [Lutibacter oricola]|uniref:Iron complex transport system permease protein n=1 Tax=Lutibacter oricola TaxID=762486 RepID=A0A1H2WCK8_9FLAO|nr:iron ABC transporter permease [Lutibacter oricola]SDW77779.1 iron complex transport system permease protein [Lutibacter oricola]